MRKGPALALTGPSLCPPKLPILLLRTVDSDEVHDQPLDQAVIFGIGRLDDAHDTTVVDKVLGVIGVMIGCHRVAGMRVHADRRRLDPPVLRTADDEEVASERAPLANQNAPRRGIPDFIGQSGLLLSELHFSAAAGEQSGQAGRNKQSFHDMSPSGLEWNAENSYI